MSHKILIDTHWENVNDLHDVCRIIREHYNDELANEMDKLIKEFEINEEEKRRLEELEEMIEDIRRIVW